MNELTLLPNYQTVGKVIKGEIIQKSEKIQYSFKDGGRVYFMMYGCNAQSAMGFIAEGEGCTLIHFGASSCLAVKENFERVVEVAKEYNKQFCD